MSRRQPCWTTISSTECRAQSWDDDIAIRRWRFRVHPWECQRQWIYAATAARELCVFFRCDNAGRYNLIYVWFDPKYYASLSFIYRNSLVVPCLMLNFSTYPLPITTMTTTTTSVVSAEFPRTLRGFQSRHAGRPSVLDDDKVRDSRVLLVSRRCGVRVKEKRENPTTTAHFSRALCRFPRLASVLSLGEDPSCRDCTTTTTSMTTTRMRRMTNRTFCGTKEHDPTN